MSADTPETRSMPTRDGVRLDAHVYRPDSPGRYPVLLMRQPYGRRIASTVTYAHPAWYARQGYVVVIQDVRGRGTSEGEFDPLANERVDGWDTVEWAASLPESDGQVGMYGFSYHGMTQLLAAISGHPALKTICPGMAGADLYNDWAYENCVFRLFNGLTWAAQLGAEGQRRVGDDTGLQACYALGHEPRQDELFAFTTETVTAPLAHSHYWSWLTEGPDSDYWRRRSAWPLPESVTLPTLHIGGWYDAFLTGTLRTHAAMAGRGSPMDHQMLVGPWAHLPWTPRVGAVDHGKAGVSPVDELQIEWFDYYLKGIGPGPEARPPVLLFDLEAGTWRGFESWPPATEMTRLHLASNGRAAQGVDFGSLRGDDNAPARTDVVVSDPWRPVPTGGGHLGPVTGRQDRSAIDVRPDVAVYTSKPLTGALDVVGSPVLHLTAHADVDVFDLHAVFSVVDGDGRVMTLTSGVLRSTGGAVRLELRPLCARIDPGKRLRLSISGARWPAFQLCDGTGRRPAEVRPTDYPVITLRLATGGNSGSALDLPVNPAGEVAA